MKNAFFMGSCHILLCNICLCVIYLFRPIHDAIESGHFEIVKYLVDHGADPTVEYSEKTPIELANTSGYPEIAEYLTGAKL